MSKLGPLSEKALKFKIKETAREARRSLMTAILIGALPFVISYAVYLEVRLDAFARDLAVLEGRHQGCPPSAPVK